MADITRTGSTVYAEVWQAVQEGDDKLPSPVLPLPQRAESSAPGAFSREEGQQSMLASLVKRVIRVFPPALFSWQAIVVGGQLLCCSSAIVLAVLCPGTVPLLLLSSIGLAIAVADIACFIKHQEQALPMEHDSIANAVYCIAQRFCDKQKSQHIGSVVSLGARLLLTVASCGLSYMSTSLGLSYPLFRQVYNAAQGSLIFLRYGQQGQSVVGQNASGAFFRLMARLFPPDESDTAPSYSPVQAITR
ncbi:pathogenicity island 2 effector protein SseG [Lonsdalea quercina]|uniref:pathogenicity island 2 effector protein SseG n=1 Tax=Lonsdalea quercina TaxID=71657 RepID=UPI003976C4A2